MTKEKTLKLLKGEFDVIEAVKSGLSAKETKKIEATLKEAEDAFESKDLAKPLQGLHRWVRAFYDFLAIAQVLTGVIKDDGEEYHE